MAVHRPGDAHRAGIPQVARSRGGIFAGITRVSAARSPLTAKYQAFYKQQGQPSKKPLTAEPAWSTLCCIRRVVYNAMKQQLLTIAAEIDRDLRVVRQILRQPVEAQIERGGLTGPQQSAMAVLVKSGGRSLKDLSKELGLAHSTVSGIVDRLQKQGLVNRQVNEADRRLSKIEASEQVTEFMRDTWPALEMHPLAEALRAATPSERQQVLDGVRILRGLLERRNQKPLAHKTE